MKVSIQVKDVPTEIQEDCEISSAKQGSPLTRLVTAIAMAMQDHPDFQPAKSYLSQVTHPEFQFTDDPRVIEVVLCDNHDDISSLLDSDMTDVLGAFATSSGFFDRERWKADAFRVVVGCHEETLRKHLIDERQKEQDPSNDRYDFQVMNGFLITITHELAHALEFIRHGGGLTPEEVENAYDEGWLEFSVSDVCTGRGIRPDMDPCLDDDDATDIMEERVEAQGIEWLDWALDKIPTNLYQSCLKACAPKAKRLALEDSGPGM